MAERQRGHSEPTSTTRESGHPAEGGWELYDPGPGRVADAAHVSAARTTPTRGWLWAAAGIIAAGLVVFSAGAIPVPGGAPVTAADERPAGRAGQWARVDPGLGVGVVVVSGGGDADGIVLTATGLIGTSYARIMGERRPPSDGFQPRVGAAGRDTVPAAIVATDKAKDIVILQAPGFRPADVAAADTPVRVGDTLTLLDNQGGHQPLVGIEVTVSAVDQSCARAGSPARPIGFQFALQVATAEPGAALVRSDGTVAGMYYGGDDAEHHCAVPIGDVVGAATGRRP